MGKIRIRLFDVGVGISLLIAAAVAVGLIQNEETRFAGVVAAGLAFTACCPVIILLAIEARRRDIKREEKEKGTKED